MVRILNLYAGIGGNRKLWGNGHDITAVEIDKNIASIYSQSFPNDKMVIGDAHWFLLEHFSEFDFIWSSPPCPSHSRIRKKLAVGTGQNEPIYPDMKLYEEILFLQHYYKGLWVVENVIAFYNPLIKPTEFGSHWFWSNFFIDKIKSGNRCHLAGVEELQQRKGFDNTTNIRLLRNCVEPELGLHILNEALKQKQVRLSML